MIPVPFLMKELLFLILKVFKDLDRGTRAKTKKIRHVNIHDFKNFLNLYL